MHEEVCAVCGRSAERLAVTQGSNRYHLECYAFKKSPAVLRAVPSPTQADPLPTHGP